MLIDGKQIKDSSITTAKVGNSQITSAKLNINADFGAGGFKITNHGSPSASTDVANKAYVDQVAAGKVWKDPVRVGSTANVAGTYNSTGGASGRGQLTVMPNTLDGVALAAGNRVLLKDQTAQAENGVWVISTLGTGANGIWDRATDFDADAEVADGATVWIGQGTINANTEYTLTSNDVVTVGGAAGSVLTFIQTGSSSGGAPTTASYVTLGTDATLTSERVLTAESGVTSLTDGGAGTTITVGIAANGVTDAKLRQVAATSVVGRSANSTGNVADIATSTDGHFLRRSGGALGFGAIGSTDLPDKPTASNKAMTAAATTADFDSACATAIAATPVRDGYVRVLVNGIGQELGDGLKTKDCYFSADGGTTARAIAAIASGDLLYWVGSVAGYQLAATDKIAFDYVA